MGEEMDSVDKRGTRAGAGLSCVTFETTGDCNAANCCEAPEKEMRDKLQLLICLGLLFPLRRVQGRVLQQQKVTVTVKTYLQAYLGPKQILFREPDPAAALRASWLLFRSLSSAWLCLDRGSSGAVAVLGPAWGSVLLLPRLALHPSPSLP